MPSGACARATKYMAKSPAKNMSSLDNHTMVPTLTRLGRFNECTRCVIADPEVPTALVTLASMTRRSKSWAIGAEIGASLLLSVQGTPRSGPRCVLGVTDVKVAG